MSKPRRKRMVVTHDQLKKIHKALFEKYPWLYRENTAYSASLVDVWNLTYDERFENEIKEALS